MNNESRRSGNGGKHFRHVLQACACLIMLGPLILAQDAPLPVEEVQKLIDKGGDHWSAPKTLTSGGMKFASGPRLWIWPLKDEVIAVKNPGVTVQFAWRLRPGQKAPAKKESFGNLVCFLPFQGTTNVGLVSFKAGADHGTFQVYVPLNIIQAAKKKEVLVRVSRNGKSESNLVRLEVKVVK